jgi:acetoin utilization deacetylase AcuC-like enzyme
MRAFYHPDYFLTLPPGHPFPMEKFPEAHADLVSSEIPDFEVVGVEPAPEPALRRIHDAAYLARIMEGTLDASESYKLGLPWKAGLYRRCRLETAGTVEATRAALEDGLAFNLAGGTHHAFPDRGSGYCVLNDVAVAIAALRVSDPQLHVLVVDTDAHQGNGTNAIFAEDPQAFTYSIHVGRNYPTAKVPGDLDVPLPRWVAGDEYLSRLAETLPPVFQRFEPDLVIWIAGADPHEDDRFGQMRLTTAAMKERDSFVARLSLRDGVPLAVLYGGGYNRKPGMTGYLHAETVRTVISVSRAFDMNRV